MIKGFLKKAPRFIQQPVRWVYGRVPLRYRLGSHFLKTYLLLMESQKWSKEEHEKFQTKELKKLLIHSYENVPYYNSLFKKVGFNPYKFRDVQEIENLPFLDKKIVEENFDDLIARNFQKEELVLQTTGGTSGKPLKFFVQKSLSLPREWAFITAQWNRMGYDYKNSKRVLLTNRVLPKNNLFQWDYINNCLIVDPYHLTTENIRRIIDRLNIERIPFIHTYPSAITIICDYIKETRHGLSYKPKAIFTSSENIYKGQREFIEKTLGTRVFSWYGHSEQLVLAGECELSNNYHIFSEYGFTELINEEDRVIKTPGVRGEIISTGFNNYVMPLIRYKTGDYSQYANETKCKCGRNYKLLNGVEGRWLQEMLVTSKGNKVSITAINMHSDIFDNVSQFQFYQAVPGKCKLRVVKKDSYSLRDEERIKMELGEKLTSELELEIEYLKEIQKTIRGKHRFLIQDIKE